MTGRDGVRPTPRHPTQSRAATTNRPEIPAFAGMTREAAMTKETGMTKEAGMTKGAGMMVAKGAGRRAG